MNKHAVDAAVIEVMGSEVWTNWPSLEKVMRITLASEAIADFRKMHENPGKAQWQITLFSGLVIALEPSHLWPYFCGCASILSHNEVYRDKTDSRVLG